MTARARRRPSGGQLTSGRWKRLRLQVIREEPVCRLRLDCCTMRSTTADHIIPVKYRPDLKYVRSNLRGSCQPCNMARGARSLSEVRKEREAAAAAVRQPAKRPAALEFFDASPPGRFENLDLEGGDSARD